MQETIEFRGSYQYATAAMLESAAEAARRHLDSEAWTADAEWPDCFSQEGATLYVHANVPVSVDGVFANGVLRALASTAMQGAVEARRGGTAHEYYFVESLSPAHDR